MLHLAPTKRYTILVRGDATVPLQAALEWARRNYLAIWLPPGCLIAHTMRRDHT